MNTLNIKINLLKTAFLANILLLGFTSFAMGQQMQNTFKSPLTMPGNEIFGTIQEVVRKLESDPNTDWSKVNLEALRQHLLDMKAFTEEVQVIDKKPIRGGVEIRVSPETKRAGGALKKLFMMHPQMLKEEKGWDMKTQLKNDIWTITCTTKNPAEVEEIRGLGYIGLIAEGSHHQYHHWLIATGKMKWSD